MQFLSPLPCPDPATQEEPMTLSLVSSCQGFFQRDLQRAGLVSEGCRGQQRVGLPDASFRHWACLCFPQLSCREGGTQIYDPCDSAGVRTGAVSACPAGGIDCPPGLPLETAGDWVGLLGGGRSIRLYLRTLGLSPHLADSARSPADSRCSGSDNWAPGRGLFFGTLAILTGFVPCSDQLPSLGLQFCPRTYYPWTNLLAMPAFLPEVLNSLPCPGSHDVMFTMEKSSHFISQLDHLKWRPLLQWPLRHVLCPPE